MARRVRLVNVIDHTETLETMVDLTSSDEVGPIVHHVVHDDKSAAQKTAAEPDWVVPRTGTAELIDGPPLHHPRQSPGTVFRPSERNRS